MVNAQYTPTGSKLTSDQLKVGYWFVAHKLLLRRIAILVLMVIDIALVSFVLYGFADYYFISRSQVKNMYVQLTSPALNYQYLSESSSPQSLVIVDTTVIKLDGKYDLVAQVDNFNQSWYVPKIVYHFESDDFVTLSQTDFILPGQTKYLMALGQESQTNLRQSDLIIEDIEWQKQADFDKLKDKILTIEIIEPMFETARQSGLSDELQVSQVKFQAYNNSAYNFWDVKMKVLLFRAGNLVAVNEIPYNYFDAGETKNTSYAIYEHLAAPNKIEIYPDIDILNPQSFKGFDGVGEAK